jgi:uncharacterized repeat protein (TIGR03803 family)
MSPKKICTYIAIYCAAVLILSAMQIASAADYKIIHNFAGGANDGSGPLLGTLIQSGSTLYGMTTGGGSNNNGVIFKIDAEGTGFEVMHSFVSAATDGQSPYGTLLLSGSTLFGMAASENTSYGGTLFKISTDKTGFQVLRSFSSSDGMWPYGSLIQSGTTLYGMNTYGGSASGYDGNGAIFKINADGTGFSRLKTFSGSTSDGGKPHGSLIQSGSVLYGTTLSGGSSNYGAIFKMNTNGTGYGLLHSFAGGSNDGKSPYATTLLMSGTTLYGMTQRGGAANNGTIFKMNTDGTGFGLLHSFAGGSNDGYQPMCGTLVQSGSMLYGMTMQGGGSNLGTVFQVNTDGTGFQLLHSFTGADGSNPWGSLYLSGSTLYGMTNGGGSQNQGVIFAITVPEPSSIAMMSIAGICLLWRWAMRSVQVKQS